MFARDVHYKDLRTRKNFGGYLAGVNGMVVRLTQKEGTKFNKLEDKQKEKIVDDVLDGKMTAKEVTGILRR